MFTSFRQRLLFYFLLVIGVSFAIVALTHIHLLLRTTIHTATGYVESSYVLLLQDGHARQDFFAYDTHNPSFFIENNSANLEQHKRLVDSIHTTIDRSLSSFRSLPYTFDHELYSIEKELSRTEAIFDTLVALIHQRGYKDFNLEGSMRNHIHWLERNRAIPESKMLMLRRLEKDYIIRNEQEYVTRLNELGKATALSAGSKNDSIRYHLQRYLSEFNQLVVLESRIGLKDNSGLKKALDESSHEAELAFHALVLGAKAKQDEAFEKLNRIYLWVIIGLLAGSIALSLVLARNITRPLTELTQFITRFVDSQFTVEERIPAVRTKDEIGKLTANFTLLKNEVITHLRYFKQKVDEQTSDLLAANKQLKEVNDANSRFVPREFLDLLGKNSIVEISSGDQIAGEMTVLFTDIRCFTELSESLSPQDNFDFINAYLAEVLPTIKANHGVIDKFIGDTVMAIFPKAPDDAIKAALDFARAVDRFNQQQAKKGIAPVSIGTGIHYGQLVLGTIGNEHRLETTVISDAVNIASRVEGLTKHYPAGTIVTEDVLHHVKHLSGVRFRYLDEVRVKGKTKSIRVFEILDPEKDAHKLAHLQEYEVAVLLMKERKWEEARNLLGELTLKCPTDDLIQMLFQRCQKMLEEGSSLQWDGIEIMHSK